MARQVRPGSRPRGHYKSERFSEARYAWLRTYLGQFIIMVRDEDDDETGVQAPTPTIQLALTRPGRNQITYNLTALTRQELDKTREFFNMLFDLAEPFVDERDKVAQDAADKGDDSYVRIYRQVPEFIVRERKIGPDRQVLRERSEDAAPGAGDDGGEPGRVRGDGSDLAPEAPEGDQSEDDEPQAD